MKTSMKLCSLLEGIARFRGDKVTRPYGAVDFFYTRRFVHTSDLAGRKERSVLFNDALNTFYLWLCVTYVKGPLRW